MTDLPLPIGTIDEHHQYREGKQFLLLPEDRRRHSALVGKSGTGKTTLLRNMIAWDIHAGSGVTVLDPHGDLVNEILDSIPKHRTNDVVYFDPRDPEYALGLNILEPPVDPRHQPLIVSYLISIFKNIWGDVSWGPRLEDILRNAAFALIEYPQPLSLIAIPKLLTSVEYRRRVLRHVTNPAVRHFFTIYEDHWDKRFREEAISPVLNKVNAFITNPLLRAILGQTRSSVDFRWLMDNGKILLCDLSKGGLGSDVSCLLGSLIVTKMALAALSRQNIPEADRRPHFLYIDEVQNFTYGVDLPTILAESRKYRLTLILATQTLEQLPKESLPCDIRELRHADWISGQQSRCRCSGS